MEKSELPNPPEAKEDVDGVPNAGVDEGVPKAGVDDGVPNAGVDEGVPKAEVEEEPNNGVDDGVPNAGEEDGVPNMGIRERLDLSEERERERGFRVKMQPNCSTELPAPWRKLLGLCWIFLHFPLLFQSISPHQLTLFFFLNTTLFGLFILKITNI